MIQASLGPKLGLLTLGAIWSISGHCLLENDHIPLVVRLI